MKKNTLKRAFSALAVSAMAVSATSLSASALYSVNNQDDKEAPYVNEYDYPHGQLDASTSEVKPHIWIDKVELSLEEAKANPVQSINVNVEGAANEVSTIGIHVIYDTRITLTPDEYGDYYTSGPATAKFSPDGQFVEPGLMTITGIASSEALRNGVMYTLNFTIPDDVYAGALYPIGIRYQSAGNTTDLFYSSDEDERAKLMMAWTFTQGN